MFGGKQATVMKVVRTPSQDLALRNCAYCSRADFSKYLLKGKDYGLGSINDNLVLKFQYPLIRMSQVSHEVWMLMLLFVSLGFGCTLQKRPFVSKDPLFVSKDSLLVSKDPLFVLDSGVLPKCLNFVKKLEWLATTQYMEFVGYN
jgi:hypothetical protein